MKARRAALALCVVSCAQLAWAQTPGQSGAVPPTPSPQSGSRESAPRNNNPGLRLPGLSIQLNLGALFNRSTPQGEEPTEPGQVLVLWPDEASAGEGQRFLQQRGLVADQRSTLVELGFVLALYQLLDDRAALALRDDLRASQPGWVVDLNARARPHQPQLRTRTPNAAAGATTARLFAQQMLGLAAGALPPSAIELGVVDTAIDHALLATPADAAGSNWNGSQITVRSMLASSDTPAPSAHGSTVALLMASAPLPNGFAGAAPAVHLHWASAMRKVGKTDSTNSWLLAQAFEWLLAQKVQLINLSLGGTGDEILRAITTRVLAKGVAVVAAAGNRADTAPVYPGAYPGVWAVTAVDAAGQPYRSATRGAHVSFAAPGVDVWVPEVMGLVALRGASGSVASGVASGVVSGVALIPGRYVSGTSYATALASAALARLPAAFWQLTPEGRKSQLCGTARAPQNNDVPMGCGVLHFEMSSAKAAGAGTSSAALVTRSP